MERGFEISWVSLWRVVGILALVGIIYYALDIWLAVFLAIVISSALDASVSWLEKKKIPRVIGALFIYLVGILALALVLYTVVPIALAELNILLKNAGKIGDAAFGVSEAGKYVAIVNEGLGKLANIFLSGSFSFFDVLSQFIGGATLAISVFILSFYLTVDRDGVEKFLLEVMPTGYEEKILEVYYRTRLKIGRWFYGQLFLSLSLGFSVFLGLWFIGVKYSLLLGILTGLLELVPFVGPIVSGAIAVLIASSDSMNSAIYVFLLYLLVQQAESTLLVPAIMKLSTSLNPAVVLISLLVGARLFGVIGIVLAVPLAVMIEELIDTWSTEKGRRKAVSSPA